MNRHALISPLSVVLILSICTELLQAQEHETDEVVSVEVTNPGEAAGKAFACPSNVSVGDRAVEFKGRVTTTSESGISYQVLIRYGSGAAAGESGGMLRHDSLETTHSDWNVSTGNGETVLELNATVVAGVALEWRAELYGESPGTVHHLWQTRLNNNIGQDESCTYEIVGVPDLVVTIDRMHPNWVEGEAGKSETSVGDATPQPGAFHVPVGGTFDLNVKVENTGDDAMSYGLGASIGPLESGGPKLFEIEEVEPPHGAPIECQVGTQGDTFTCEGSALVTLTILFIRVRVALLVAGPGIFVVGGAASGEEDLSDNNDDAGIEVLPEDNFGRLVGQKLGRRDLGLGEFVEFPLDGFDIELKDPSGTVRVATTTGPVDLNADGAIDAGTERGIFVFESIPQGNVVVEEVPVNHAPPFDPLSGQLQVDVTGGATTSVTFKNMVDSVDYGDLPDKYTGSAGPCPVANCFPRPTSHLITRELGLGLNLGLGIVHDTDPDPMDQPQEAADGDDLDGYDDELAVRIDSLIIGGMGSLSVTVYWRPEGDKRNPQLAGWIDFNDDGMFSLRERIVDKSVGHGEHMFTFSVPPNAITKYARFRISTKIKDLSASTTPFDDLDPESWGNFIDGEVEDYYLPPPGIDFGDAPETMDPDRPDFPFGYPTTRENNGARHVAHLVTNLRIGPAIDVEEDAKAAADSDGDDYDNLYDEDGIQFADGFTPVRIQDEPRELDGQRTTYGVPAAIDATIIPLAGRDGKLDGWIDFNGDGDWEDDGEHIIPNVDVQGPPFYTPVTFSVPEGATPGWTFGRFRFSSVGGLDFVGEVEGGEVEDYLLQILPAVLRITNDEDSGPGSVRQNIEDANADGGSDPVYIVYENGNAAGKAAAVITLESPLPEMTRPVILSGGGSLVLDGSQAGEDANGLVLSGGSIGIHGVTITNFSGHGIVVNSDSNTVSNNTISDNAGDGVRTNGSSANRIMSNVLTGNGGLAVDIGGDGPTANDADDQDGIPNYPVITSVVRGSTTISGTLSSKAETTFLLQFFADDECTEGNRGVAASLVGAGSVTTDAGGFGEFEIVLEQTLDKDVFVVATATGPDGTSELSECGVQVTPIEQDPVETAPESFSLGANYPNPFASETTIPFDIAGPGHARLEIFNSLGQVVRIPVDTSFAPGRYRVTLDAATLPSGVYYYRMTTEGRVQTRKMIVVR